MCPQHPSLKSSVQVVHSYGEKPNEDFLQYYGFVDMENVRDAYTADLMQWVKQHFHAETGRVQSYGEKQSCNKSAQTGSCHFAVLSVQHPLSLSS